MLRFSFAIFNFLNTQAKFVSYVDKTFKVSKFKRIELQVWKFAYYILEFYINTNFSGSDHAGPEITIGVFGFCLHVSLLDVRHWDNVNNNWEKYENINS